MEPSTTLGRTGITVPRLSAGGHFTVGPTSHSDKKRRIRELNYLIDAGITYHDVQWDPEMEVMAEVLRTRVEDITVAWPLHGVTDKGGELTANYIVEYCQNQCRKYGIEHVDIVLWIALELYPDTEESTMAAFRDGVDRIKRDGFCNHVGFSCHHSPEMAMRAIRQYDDFAVVMTPYSVLHPAAGRALYALARSKGIGTVAMKPFGGGDGLFNKVFAGEVDEPDMAGFLGSGRPYQAALKWVLADVNVDCTVPGMHSCEEIDELITAAGESLSGEDEAILKEYRRVWTHSDVKTFLARAWD